MQRAPTDFAQCSGRGRGCGRGSQDGLLLRRRDGLLHCHGTSRRQRRGGFLPITTNPLKEGPDKKPNKQPYGERYQEKHGQPFVPPHWPYPSPPHHPIPSLVPYPLLSGSLELPKQVLSPSSYPAHIVHAPSPRSYGAGPQGGVILPAGIIGFLCTTLVFARFVHKKALSVGPGPCVFRRTPSGRSSMLASVAKAAGLPGGRFRHL